MEAYPEYPSVTYSKIRHSDLTKSVIDGTSNLMKMLFLSLLLKQLVDQA